MGIKNLQSLRVLILILIKNDMKASRELINQLDLIGEEEVIEIFEKSIKLLKNIQL